MSKKELKRLNELYFRWWNDEVKENEKLLRHIVELRKENSNLKRKYHENRTRTR